MLLRRCSRPAVGLTCILALAGCAARQVPDTAPTRSSRSDASVSLDNQIVRYVDVQVALAADDYGRAHAALQALMKAADGATAPLVRSAATAQDIDTLRTRFKPLSEYLAAQDLPDGYARAYCPMYDGGSSWVQADGPVRNPYYGAVMLTCGVVDAAPGAHMDHAPQHGGTVFMAPDGFHHIEGTYADEGIFRLYATDNFREPVDVRSWSGRAVLEEAYDSTTDEFTEVVAFQLKPDAGAAYLEAVIEGTSLPTEVTAKVQFGINGETFPEERFDFVFTAFTAAGQPDGRDSASGAPVEAPLPLSVRIQPDLPELTTDLVASIGVRLEQLRTLIEAGRFPELFVPALQGKEIALELETRDEIDSLPPRARSELRIAVRQIVRAAYLLDWYGDLGNKQQVAGAFDVYSTAVRQLMQAYSSLGP